MQKIFNEIFSPTNAGFHSFTDVQHWTSERIDVVWHVSSLYTTAKNSWRRYPKLHCVQIVRTSLLAFDASEALYCFFFDMGTSDVMSHDNIIIRYICVLRVERYINTYISHALSQIYDWTSSSFAGFVTIIWTRPKKYNSYVRSLDYDSYSRE